MIRFETIIIYATRVLQENISLVTTKAEYVALLGAAKAVMATPNVDQASRSTKSTTIFQDNYGNTKWATRRKEKYFLQPTHIAVRHNHLLNEIHSHDIDIVYVPTEKKTSTFC